MRNIFYFLTFFFFCITLKAQLPNPDFETWNTTTTDKVDIWDSQGKITKVSGGQLGSYAAKIETSLQGILNAPGTLALTSAFPDGYPYAYKTDTIKIWVKYNVVNMDTATIHIEQMNNATLVRAGNRFITVGTVNTWTEISIPMEVIDTSLTPLSILITMTNSLDYNPQVSSYLMVDNIRCYNKGVLQATLPNNSFESWSTQTSMQLDKWTSSNDVLKQFGIDSINCEQSPSSQSGSYAVKVRTLDILGVFIPGGIVTGIDRLDAATDPASFPTFPVNVRYSSLSGYLKFTKQATDKGEAAVYMFKDGLLVGQGHYYQSNTISSYTQFEAKIIYIPSFTGIPDSGTVAFLSASDPNNATGACVLWIDNIRLNTFGLGISDTKVKNEIYPNPFTDKLNVIIASENARLSITSLDGKELSSETVSKGLNEISTASLDKGLYILTIVDGENTTTLKVVKK